MKIALVLNDDFSMWHFRGDLIRRLVAAGHDVTVVVPPGDYRERLESLGARCLQVPMARFVDPVADLLLLWRLMRVFRRERFDLVHNMTVKPNIFGSLAARAARIPRIVCLVSGLGFVFKERPNLKGRMLRRLVMPLYRLAMRVSDRTWFQNPDDYEYFVEKRLIPPEKGVVIRSGGINLGEYAPDVVPQERIAALRRELGIAPDAPVVLTVAARLVWSKGVREFIEASQELTERYPGWVFVMLCPRDPDSDEEVPPEYIERNRHDRLVVVDTFREDVKTFTAMASVVVLASYYREGVPRTLLEGLAMSKPILTCDSVGCREVVRDGENGFLVPVRDSAALADKLAVLMDDESCRREFGSRSRRLAEEVFDERLVVASVIENLYGIRTE